jgi:hypothetical protein
MRSIFTNKTRAILGVKEVGSAKLLNAILGQIKCTPFLRIYAHKSAAKFFKKNSQIMEIEELASINIASVFEKDQPDFVIVGSSIGPSIEKLFMEYAKQTRIPIYSVIDNNMNIWQRFANLENAEKWYYTPDKIFVTSNEMYLELEKEGYKPANLIKMAHPLVAKNYSVESCKTYCDQFLAKYSLQADQIFLTLVLEEGLPSSDIWKWDNLDIYIKPKITSMLRALLDFAKYHNNDQRKIKILIKRHPTDRSDNFSKIFACYDPDIYKLIIDNDNSALFRLSAGIFGIGSMLLYEAASKSNTRVYSMKLNADSAYPRIGVSDNIKIINSEEDLRQTLLREYIN